MMAQDVPSNLEAIRRAEQFRRAGKTLLAAEELHRILTRDSDHYAANYMLGMLYHDEGNSTRAIPLLKKAAAVRPDHFVAVLNLGIIQHQQGLLADAQASLERAVLLAPADARAHAALGLLLQDDGKPDEAAKAVDRSLALDPANADTLVTRGSLHQAGGDLANAAACYTRALLQSPLHGEACYRLSLLERLVDDTGHLGNMEAAWRTQSVPAKDRILVGYALGRTFDQGRQFDRAFRYFQEANELQNRAQTWSLEAQAAFIDRHKQGINREFVENCKGHASTDDTPIFIVGMPRSGTSLVEQILASHPAVHAAGEAEYSRILVEDVEQRTGQPFPLDIGRVDRGELAESCRKYIAKLRTGAGAARRITDKLPHNFLRIGLYAAMMPNASIVLCERDPLDNCLSIYQHFFTATHGYATNLSALGAYYRLYQDLMAYWDELFPGRIHHLRYETLVHDTENQVKLLLARCGLEFHPDCLSFHQKRRSVSTPSDAQVRKPVYVNAVGRWRHYEKQLRPLQQALREATGPGLPGAADD
jgi:tetratricopeptide (TPR) repeat protein